jgi:hypothetical protein
MIALFHMATTANYGGFTTYTVHLIQALRAAGQQAEMFKVRKTVEKKQRPYSHGITYQNVTPDAAAFIASKHTPLIACCYWPESPQGTEVLLAGGSSIVLHDPTELSPELMAALLKYKPKVIAIRKNNVDFFASKGIENITYVPHPYVPIEREVWDSSVRPVHATTTCRVDFDKYTHEVITANKLLPPEKRVRLRGQANRIYVFHKLSKMHPDWEEHYGGPFPRYNTAAFELLSEAKFSVDMSRIAGDGGGSQYSFLEAWNAGAHLVVHRGWLMPGGELIDGYNCTAVDSPEHLAEVLSGEPDPCVIAGGYETLAKHSGELIVPQILKVIQ